MATNFSVDIGRKPLFSELFKHNNKNPPVTPPPPPPSPPPSQKNLIIRNESNISNGSFSQFSSSSTSPLGSELSSAETDNDENHDEWNVDFIHELTRQITDSMLNEEEEEEEKEEDQNQTIISKSAVNVTGSETQRLHISSELNRQRRRFQKHRRGKNRERFVANYGAVESCQRPTYMSVPPLDSGSGGMTAVFLGKPGLVNGSYGTGVFLPRAAVAHPPESRKKGSGSSTVLIPTRVMQLLQLHFANVKIKPHQDSITKDTTIMNSCTSRHQHKPSDESMVVQQNQETVLPQEWTY